MRTKTVMEQMNAEKPDDVLADLESKHGSEQRMVRTLRKPMLATALAMGAMMGMGLVGPTPLIKTSIEGEDPSPDALERLRRARERRQRRAEKKSADRERNLAQVRP